MHPVILTAKKAESMIARIMAAVKIERWVPQEHLIDEFSGSIVVAIVSHYGRTQSGGGFVITLISFLTDNPERAPEDEETLEIVFNFSRGGNIVSCVEFSYGLNTGSWFAVHESTEFLRQGMEDPATGLAQQLGIELNNRGVDHVEEELALGKIALAADYTFAHCDEPDNKRIV